MSDRTSTIISYSVLAFFSAAYILPTIKHQIKDPFHIPFLNGFEASTLIILIQAVLGVLRYSKSVFSLELLQ